MPLLQFLCQMRIFLCPNAHALTVSWSGTERYAIMRHRLFGRNAQDFTNLIHMPWCMLWQMRTGSTRKASQKRLLSVLMCKKPDPSQCWYPAKGMVRSCCPGQVSEDIQVCVQAGPQCMEAQLSSGRQLGAAAWLHRPTLFGFCRLHSNCFKTLPGTDDQCHSKLFMQK